MKTKKMLALMMSSALCLSAGVASVQAEESEDLAALLAGNYFNYSYDVEGLGDLTCFIHFYEEAPVLGSVFYASYAFNQICYAGTYTVEEAEYDYACYADREAVITDGSELLTGTAPYTVTFYDWDGNVLDSCGFDGEILYNDMQTVSGTGDSDVLYHLDADIESSSHYDTYVAEVGVAYLDFVGESDETSTLTLYHNGTYSDLVNFWVEGTWEMTEAEDGYEYVLTPDSESDTAAILTVAADTATAVYVPEDGDEVAMVNTATTGPSVFYQLVGEAPLTEDTNADVVVTMYDDGSAIAAISAYGSAMEIDTGSYSIGDDGYTITFTFKTAGEIVSSLDYETGQVSIQYVQEGTMIGDIDTTLNLVVE